MIYVIYVAINYLYIEFLNICKNTYNMAQINKTKMYTTFNYI